MSVSPLDSDDNESTEGIEEYVFEPADFVDCTLHYDNVSFHLHQNWLYVGSGYFKALFKSPSTDDEDCCLTEKCIRPHHRCVTISDTSIGGTEVSVGSLLNFLRQLYCEVDGSGSWREKYIEEFEVERQYKMSKYWYIARCNSVDVTNDLVCFLCYNFDDLREKQVHGSSIIISGSTMQTSEQQIGTWIQNAQYDDPPHFHLANYFECPSLMKRYENMALSSLNKAIELNLYSVIWRILRSADQYHWKTTRLLCIEACLNDRECGKRPKWVQLFQTFDIKLMSELFARAVAHC